VGGAAVNLFRPLKLMSRLISSLLPLSLLLAALALTAPNLTAAARPSNIIIMNTDDHAQWAVGAYGNKEIHTPNMDRLAREGIRFNRAFSKPVCSPSRAMTLTGQYSHRLGIPDYIPYGNPVYATNGLPAGTPTIASVLKNSGYTSALIGKWHLGYGEKYYPERFGFEVAEGHPYVAPGNKYNGLESMPSIVDGKEVFGFKSKRQTDILTDRAIHFLRENREKPFFLFFNPFVTHQGYWSTVPDEDLAQYKDNALTVPDLSRFPEVKMDEEGLRKLMRIYYGSIACADRNLGRLLATLDELNLTQNTFFIFMADNGMNLGQLALIGKGNANILGSKPPIYRPNMFDRSVLVPFIVRWPGVVKAGATSDALISTIDILPTLIEATGAVAGEKLQLDGRSLLPLLKGEKVGWRNAYSDTYDMIYLAETHMRMIRTEHWKLVLYLDAEGNPLANGNRHELFDLQNDAEELTNLYGKPSVAAIQQQLDTRLRGWMRETGVTKQH
jgi:choline-sulfatase